MAAIDYIIVEGCLGTLYLAKKKKPTKRGPQTMSQDRRPITDSEMIGCFEHYLRNWVEEHEGEDTVVITSSDGKKIFEAKLLDKEETPSIVDPQPEKPVSEDMDKAAFQAYLEAEDKKSYIDTYIDGFEAGAKWDRQLLTKNAVKGVVHHFGDDEIAAIHYNDPKGVPMSYFISSDSLKAGDNVKLITIKED